MSRVVLGAALFVQESVKNRAYERVYEEESRHHSGKQGGTREMRNEKSFMESFTSLQV